MERAKDVCQEAYMKMFEKLDLTIEDEKIKAWLIHTADNAAKDILKKGGRYREIAQSGTEEETAAELSKASGPRDDYEELLRADFRSRLLDELKKHSEKQYEVMVYTCCLGMSLEETAHRMNMNYRQAANCLYRARCWIREHFAGEYEQLRH